MKVLFVILLALVSIGLIISCVFIMNLTRRGERLFRTGIIISAASMVALLYTALLYALLKGL